MPHVYPRMMDLERSDYQIMRLMADERGPSENIQESKEVQW